MVIVCVLWALYCMKYEVEKMVSGQARNVWRVLLRINSQHSSKTISERENLATNKGGPLVEVCRARGWCCSLFRCCVVSALTKRTTSH